MSSKRYTEEFKVEAVKQITERSKKGDRFILGLRKLYKVKNEKIILQACCLAIFSLRQFSSLTH